MKTLLKNVFIAVFLGICAVGGFVAAARTLDVSGTFTTQKSLNNWIATNTVLGDMIDVGTPVTSTAAELNIMDGVTSSTAELNILDGVTATFAEVNYIDLATLGTGVASKAIVLDASGDYTGPATLNFNVPSGGDITLASGSTLDVAGTFEIANVAMTSSAAELNYNDIATLGTGAASKAIVLDASGDWTGPATLNFNVPSSGTLALASGSVFTVDGTTLTHSPLLAQGRAQFQVCGDVVTVNNNTVYYGPDRTVVSSATVGQVKCDTTAAGSTTESTADSPAFTAKAFYVLGMSCYHPDAGSNLTFTARSAEAGLTPALVVSTTDNDTQGMTSAPSTTAVASGATFAVAVASTADVGTVPFICNVDVAY